MEEIVLSEELKNELNILTKDVSEVNPYLHYTCMDTDVNPKRITFTFTFGLPTLAFTEEEYNNYIKLVNSLSIKKEKYEISFSYDGSGYDYWKNIMNEDLWVDMDIIIYADMVGKEIDNFIKDIYHIGQVVDDFEMNIWKTDEEYDKRIVDALF